MLVDPQGAESELQFLAARLAEALRDSCESRSVAVRYAEVSESLWATIPPRLIHPYPIPQA